jgi:hypothetical protein
VKKCTSCDKDKDLCDFYYRKGKPRSECKECTLAQNKKTISKEAKLRGQANYRRKNKPALNQKHSEYKKNNRAICNAQWMKYHASKLNATPEWLTKEHHEQIKLVYAHAKECELLTGDKYHVDHIIPLQGKNVSGLHVPWNLQVLPADINIKKSNSYGEDTF